ncbi:phage tail tip lysozyme [Mesorhizobium sp. RP14(2022)]|uniref:Phage tail tip lysozyme n=1 Tax=Mesorhizobium liriopis TaxID=2953882 RepID=A0ABT1CA31_9HYPH|nr:phage tail tip lysozyme [Mesorhizobium liriopis]MCO6050826.1 phage tail tip lysozyme [Mesorhizobium liriopis]
MTFETKAPKIMSALLSDFPIGLEDAAAIVGNLGHESGGFADLQEINPTVAGSRGGYGWAQWTGPRRRAYEAYCQRNRLNPASDRANYAYLFVELKGSERKAIPAVVAASGLEAKVKAFEMGFERAGVKHYPSRIQWAKKALAAWNEATASERVPDFLPAPVTVPEAADLHPEPIIVMPETAVPAPAPIGHNGGPALDPEPRPANPSPTPVEQSSKAVGAGKWAAILGALWTVVVASDVLPTQFTTPAFTAAVTALLAAAGGVVGAYIAPANAVPGKTQ